jgi:hypothetical protein
MTSDLYARMVDALSVLRHLEHQGCHVTAAHCTVDATTIQIDPPPDQVLAHWSFAFVPPARGLAAAPVTLRLDLGSRTYVEWHPRRRPTLRPAPEYRDTWPHSPQTIGTPDWPCQRAPGVRGRTAQEAQA